MVSWINNPTNELNQVAKKECFTTRLRVASIIACEMILQEYESGNSVELDYFLWKNAKLGDQKMIKRFEEKSLFF